VDEPAVVLAGDPARGEVLVGLGACRACHTAEGGEPFAGGYGIQTRFGTFFAPNITPDGSIGIGGWSFGDFVRAMREGRSPSGRPYAAAFPYAAYTRTTDADLADLWAYLTAVPAVAAPERPHEVRWPYDTRLATGVWRAFEFRREASADDRGEYLATGPGHCGECHTPRNAIGGLRARREFQGNDQPPEPAPDLTGLVDWTQGDVVELLTSGIARDGDMVSGVMRELVVEGTSRLSLADREAVAAYVLSRPPNRHPRPAEPEDNDGEDW
jgi:mono/diheme cytochrome c family protein